MRATGCMMLLLSGLLTLRKNLDGAPGSRPSFWGANLGVAAVGEDTTSSQHEDQNAEGYRRSL